MLTLFPKSNKTIICYLPCYLAVNHKNERHTNNVHAHFSSFWQAYIIDSYCFGLSMIRMMKKCSYLTSIEYRRKYSTQLAQLLLLFLSKEELTKVLYLCFSGNDYDTAFDCSSTMFSSVDHILLFNLHYLEG